MLVLLNWISVMQSCHYCLIKSILSNHVSVNLSGQFYLTLLALSILSCVLSEHVRTIYIILCILSEHVSPIIYYFVSNLIMLITSVLSNYECFILLVQFYLIRSVLCDQNSLSNRVIN